MTNNKKIIFIHGMFVTSQCWVNWIKFFSDNGYECFAPAWPHKNDSPENLRKKHPDTDGEGKVRLLDVLSSYESFIKSLDEKPILVGHSMGGLVAQILLDKGLGCCGVAIDSAPPQGVFTAKWSFLKANWPVVNPFTNKNKPVLWSKEQFQYAFAGNLYGEELDRAYRSIVPQSKLVPRDSLGHTASINYRKKTSPLLLIAGEMDNIIPSSLNKSNYNRYRSSKSQTDFKEFPNRTHYLINDKGWEEIAQYILEWLPPPPVLMKKP